MRAKESPIDLIVVTGPTATGKTRLAVTLAEKFNGEILSADSRQTYRGLDIGTGKDLEEYGKIPYHLIDVADPREVYTLSDFVTDASAALRDIRNRQKTPILAGGTPLWIHALLNAYTLPGGEPDPKCRAMHLLQSTEELSETLRREFPKQALEFKDWDNTARLVRALEIGRDCAQKQSKIRDIPPLRVLILAPFYSRQIVRERIKVRLDARLEAGMIEEVSGLLSSGVPSERLISLGLEYRYLTEFMLGELDFQTMRTLLLNKIHQFAKRQDVWFRKFEREGIGIHWLPDGDPQTALTLSTLFLNRSPLPSPEIRLNEIVYGPRSQ